MSRQGSVGCLLLALALGACQQTVSLDDQTDGGRGANGGGTGGTNGGGPRDASVDGRCFGGPDTPISFTTDVPQMVVALDRSSAMSATFGMTDQLHAALNAIQADVSRYGGGHNGRLFIQFAFVDFPDNSTDCNASNGCCPSDVTSDYSDFQNGSTCSGSSGPNSCVQSSNRPTAAALNQAYDYFMFGGSAQHNNERYVLLVSDDDPGGACPSETSACNDAEVAVLNLAGIGVTTEVVAIGAGAPCLKELATEQSVFPAPYTVTSSPNDLPDAIDQVAAAVAQNACRLTLSSAPDSGHLTVTFGGVVQSQDSGMSGNGWNTDGNTRVFLHGNLCQSFLQASSNGSFGLQIFDGCGDGH